jgi:hypothetical protein
MARERPGVVTAAAVLNLIVGGLGLLCGLCGVGANLFTMSVLGNPNSGNPASSAVADMLKFMESSAPGFQLVEVGKPALVVVLSVLALIAGMGLLNVKGWARTLTFLYAVVTILLHLGYVIYEFALVLPAVQAWEQDFVRRQGALAAQQSGNFAAGGVGVVLGAALFIGHAAVVLVLLLLPAASAAFAGAGRDRYDDEDDDDELDGPRRPRRREDDEDQDDEDDEDRGRVRRRDRDY